MIPTAEEILIKESILLKTIEESGNFPLNLTRDTHIGTAKNIKKAMIEFAKLHVEVALKEASKNSKVNINGFLQDYDESCCVDENSILNAYPLENIK